MINKVKRIILQINIIDLVVLLAFALYSLLFFLGRWQGQKPFVSLDSDAANIASFAAATYNPERFVGDAILSTQSNFQWYMTIHIPLLRVLRHFVGDYGTAFIYMLGFHVFFQLAGFYLFGVLLFKNRFWAFLLSVMTMATLWTPALGDYWGNFMDPQPRFTFQALLPYLLSGVLAWRSNITRWPILMVGAGLLMYVHPVSAPAWAFAIWLGLWLLLPSGWPLKKRFGFMILMGLIFLLTVLPFMATYLSLRDIGKVANYEQVYNLMITSYKNYMDIVGTFILYIKTFKVYLGVATLGMIIVAVLDRKNSQALKLTLVWLSGILLVSVVFPALEHQIARATHRIPAEIDLVRGVRFIAPFMILYWLWATLTLLPYAPRIPYLRLFFTELGSSAFYAVVSALAVIYLYRGPMQTLLPLPQQALGCWSNREWTCVVHEDRREHQDLVRVLDKIRETPERTLILPFLHSNESLAVRYYAFQPVVFSGKDGGVLSYSDVTKFLERNDLLQEVLPKITDAPSDALKFQELLDFANKLGAERLVIASADYTLPPRDFIPNEMIVYRNKTYILINIHP